MEFAISDVAAKKNIKIQDHSMNQFGYHQDLYKLKEKDILLYGMTQDISHFSILQTLHHAPLRERTLKRFSIQHYIPQRCTR